MDGQLAARGTLRGRTMVLVIVALLVAGVAALAFWTPSAQDIRNTKFVNAALGSGIHKPLVDVPGGDATAGRSLIRQYGCMACHTIPGVPGANGTAGPPLDNFANRTYIAGVLPNTPDNLIHWLQHPQEVVPGNDMPDLDVSEDAAKDIAAYLYTLRGQSGVLP